VRTISRILLYVRPYWALALASVVITLLTVLAALVQPWPLQVLVDNVLSEAALPGWLVRWSGPSAARTLLLAVVVLAGLAVALMTNLLAVLENYVNTRMHQGLALDFRCDLFGHAQRLSLAYHDQRRTGNVIYMVNYQADAGARIVLTILPLAQSLLTLAGMFGITLRLDWQLALLASVVAPFLYMSVGYYARHIQPRIRDVKYMEGESLSIIHEAMSMLRVIVAFGREPHEHRRFREQGQQMAKARVNITVRQTIFSMIVNMLTATGMALVLALGAAHVLDGSLTTGQLLVVLAYIAAVYKPLETISYTVGSLQEQIVSLRVAFELLDTEPSIQDVPGAVALKRAEGRVTFERVYFSYAGRDHTLRDIAFEARPGQVVAIVGPTGAGKTTLVSLIPRFYEATRGRVLLDGHDVRQITLRSLRQQISLVLQEPLLFRGTIADNIRYGRLDATPTEIVEAARAANAHDFIIALPKGYDAQVGERGVQLSGGERQRIAIARAFLKNAPILILDEPTSSIDSRTEAAILDALDQLMQGRTTFMIAHRLSTLRRADMILVMEHGRLVERGTREELLRRGGLFKQMHDLQIGPARLDAPPVAAVAEPWPA
jgi:ABC-type multidrug transport system fused ATPase/permease subunit